MQHQRGFTLIELIIVIVILGILAVTAAPKFIDIQADANRASVQGVKAALQGGSQLVYAKAAIAGKQRNATGGTVSSDSQVTIGSNTVELEFGYPKATTTSLANVKFWVDLNATDWRFTLGAAADNSTPALGTFAISPSGNTAPADFTTDICHVLFTEADDEDTPATVSAVVTGC
ncbi:MAG: MSHA pilin protein MshA [Paraglaciecola sp.]|jgi:MSHA pilin protein MshA